MWKLVLINALNSVFRIMEFLVIVNAFASWVPFFWQNPTMAKIMNMINYLTEPLLKPVRKLLAKTPAGNMPIDISPIIAILLLGVVQNVLVIVILAVG